MRVLFTVAKALGPGGDEKSGVRADWIDFLAETGRTSKLLVISARNNTFNNTFEGSAAIYYHREDISKFLHRKEAGKPLNPL